uniref:Non-specific lipid-transfer protein n=1 Tax=Cuphea paucipetala TaxID=857164 RepID=A0A0U1WTV0_9MYRT|nr:non-specific lipid transfer protein 4 [Cuphea paucipetala]
MAFPTTIPRLVCIALIGMLVVSAPDTVESAVSYNQVMNYLTPCVNFVLYGGAVVSQQCCTGVQTLYAAAGTTQDRQGVCSCLKSAINGMPVSNFNINNAASLPSRCGVSVPYKISPSTDCKSVK